MRLHHLARVTLVVRDLEAALAEHGFEQAQISLFNVPEARALSLGVPAIAGVRAALIVGADATIGIELIEQPNAQANMHPSAERLGWAGFERKPNGLNVTLNCLDSAVSAAFYLGLGANDVQQIAAQTRVIQLKHSALRFASGKTDLPAMDLANLSMGILSVQLARIGSRGQIGPARVLRGLDAELIELV